MPQLHRYAGKVAIVTGGASGIGDAVTRQLVAEDAKVLIADINVERGKAIVAELGSNCTFIKTNVTREDDVKAMVAAAVDRFGRLDVAFNVAGTTRMGQLLTQSEADFRFSIDITLVGSFLCLQHEARQMVANGVRGAIVNVASLNAHVPAWGLAASCAAKAGLEMLAKSAAIELTEHGIRVNTVSPGLTDTPASGYMTPEMAKAFMERIPFKRMAKAEELAEACLFLGSDAASYITGVNLFVDGGWQHSAFPDTRIAYRETPSTLT